MGSNNCWSVELGRGACIQLQGGTARASCSSWRCTVRAAHLCLSTRREVYGAGKGGHAYSCREGLLGHHAAAGGALFGLPICAYLPGAINRAYPTGSIPFYQYFDPLNHKRE
ncbi:hypothetical protein GOBAR_AA01755 [Gossypium barbadense]|uniref:Uncharacterized protein n=1 Tax=Gossypium barbadense TaxID=3634 RepID=A0A2P5YTA5_GOSBA|nr:hypothetical protein GOBAR_AA01755 [Gossypium barbadense]